MQPSGVAFRTQVWRAWPNAGEMACYLGHRKVWALIRDAEALWVFVAEDDVHFSADPFLDQRPCRAK